MSKFSDWADRTLADKERVAQIAQARLDVIAAAGER
mgnify:CR=1 FL=1